MSNPPLMKTETRGTFFASGFQWLAMSEDDDEVDSEEFDFEEWKRKNEERRKERLKHASYGWVETVREAGELYRDLEQTEAVSEELDLSKDTAQEALAVYDLIFKHPQDKISSRTAIGGRAYFSLEKDVEGALEDCDEKKVEEVVREFVGAIYLQNDLEEHEVGSPPENSTPPSNVDWGELSDIIAENFSTRVQKMAASSGVSSISDNILETQASRMADALKPAMEQRDSFVRRMAESINAQNKKMMQDILSRGFPPIARQLQRQQEMLNTSIAKSMTGLNFPEPLLADLESIQPQFDTTAATVAPSSTTETRNTASTSSTPSASAETGSVEADYPVEYPVDPTTSTPNATPTNPELAMKLSVEITKTILYSDEVWSWFKPLSKRQQIAVIQLLLLITSWSMTQNATLTTLLVTSSDIVRRITAYEQD